MGRAQRAPIIFIFDTNVHVTNWTSIASDELNTNKHVSLDYRTPPKRTLPQWHMTIADPVLASCLLSSFIRNICQLWSTCPPALCTVKAPDEKLKINELGPTCNYTVELGYQAHIRYLAHTAY